MAQKWLEQERAWWCAVDNRVEVEKRLEKRTSLPFCVRIAANGEPCLSVRQLDGKFVHSKFTVDAKSGACSIVQKGQAVTAPSLRGLLEKLGYVEAPPPPAENLYVDFAPAAERVVSTYGEPPAASEIVKSKGSGLRTSAPAPSPSSASSSTGSGARRRRHRRRSARNVKDGVDSGSSGSEDDAAEPPGYVPVPDQEQFGKPSEPPGYVPLPISKAPTNSSKLKR
jgi:hypothetical protein